MIQSQTGSGKTLAFLLPLLAALEYPPQLYPEDLKVPSMQHEQDTTSLHNVVVVGLLLCNCLTSKTSCAWW